jgi:hypothetical protein
MSRVATTIENFICIALRLMDVSRDHVATAVEARSAGYIRMHSLFRAELEAHTRLNSFTAINVKKPEI